MLQEGDTRPDAGGDESDRLLDNFSRVVSGVADRVGATVVRVETSGARGPGLGSGVVIANDGLVLTNSHVVGGARQVRLSSVGGRRNRRS